MYVSDIDDLDVLATMYQQAYEDLEWSKTDAQIEQAQMDIEDIQARIDELKSEKVES